MTTNAGVEEALETLTQRFQTVLDSSADIALSDEGATQRHCVAQWQDCRLYRYGDKARQTDKRPAVLLVYALVNRPVILDLLPNVSTVERLLEEGLDVYLLDWGEPPSGEAPLTLDDYVNRYIDRAVDHVCEFRDQSAVNIMGICQGGTLSIFYAALHPEKVARLVTVVTPVDFHTPDNLLSHWSRLLDIDLIVDASGNIPGGMLTSMFKSLQPGRLLLEKYLGLAESLDKLDDGARKKRLTLFLAMERWISDSPDQSGEAFRSFVKGCYQQNLLIKSQFKVGNRQVKLDQLTMPVFNIYASQDHLVPTSASKVLESLVESDRYQALEINTGHIGIFVSQKALQEMPAAIAHWLQ